MNPIAHALAEQESIIFIVPRVNSDAAATLISD
jgi:hypothetical protein